VVVDANQHLLQHGYQSAKRVEMVRHAYDMGVRYFDTSRNCGESESVMGRGLKGVRENVFLATKVGVDWKKEAI
jgi:aryl-alcohol dehydrogenase-like predicted oxidoreductase